MSGTFKLVTDFMPAGDQPQAIAKLVQGLRQGKQEQTLLGVTGSGKTFTMAQVIAAVNRPALVIAPNKTLAAQLYSEFRQFFPENAVEYFVSYYDYYQPEAYLPAQDLFIEKDSAINEEIDKMRHAATRSLLERNDVIIVASVSCIYGLGSPEAYHDLLVFLEAGAAVDRNKILADLVKIQYTRNDTDFHRGTFRVRGDVIEIFPAHEGERAIRVEFFGDSIERLCEVDPLRGRVTGRLEKFAVYPASHFVAWDAQMKKAVASIRDELQGRIVFFKEANRLVEAQRIEQRTLYDLEMIEEMGFCKGIENYSRHITGRAPGEPPPTLLDYFPKGYLMFIDESHVAVPQIGGMHAGDRSRKEALVDFGFRLPSALDNRPLTFGEFEARRGQVIYVSATPGAYELERSGKEVIQQIIRPTGLIDPRIAVRPTRHQVDDLLAEIRRQVAQGHRVLVTTLTKRMAEDLTEYYREQGIKVRYLHSDIETIERVEILRDLRLGTFDVLIGINLLREGLDLPEVVLVAILDADKEGFLRSERSLVQTFGRAARHIEGSVILYADTVTQSMAKAINETKRRRKIQEDYNQVHGITPQTVKKEIVHILDSVCERDYYTVPKAETERVAVPAQEIPRLLDSLRREMKKAAAELDFERAAELRDQIRELQQREVALGLPT